MKNLSIFIMLVLTLSGFAQEKKEEPKIGQIEKQLLRRANDFYADENYVDSEVQYKKALEQNPNYKKANYNLGNAIYQQNRFKDALPMYELAAKTTENKFERAESFHNTGNVMMKEKQYAQAIEAYKNSLRNNAEDDETRYNLALAQKLLKKEEQNNKDKNKDQNKDNKDKDDDQNKKDDQDKDKKGDDKDKKDENKDQKGDKDKEKQEPKPQQNKLTPQQVKQLLEAMNNEENKTQKKVNAKKAKGRKVKQEKDW